jgi:hypothetical protein
VGRPDRGVAGRPGVADQAALRREEELEGARVARQRRDLAETFETERQAGELEQQRLHARLAAEQDQLTAESPVRLLRIENERAILAAERLMRQVQNEVTALDVERDLLLPRAKQEMRLALLPVEQTPQIVESASRVLQGTNLSFYGEGAEIMGQLAPFLDLVTRAVGRAGTDAAAPAPAADPESALTT